MLLQPNRDAYKAIATRIGGPVPQQHAIRAHRLHGIRHVLLLIGIGVAKG